MLQFCRNMSVPTIGLLLMIFGHNIAFAQIAWIKSYDEALKQAAREKKFVILDVSASW